MLETALSGVITASIIGFTSLLPSQSQPAEVLSSHSISLDNRQINKPLNDIYKDNILLNLIYMTGLVLEKSQIDWESIRQNQFNYEFKLKSGETFAFHDSVLDEYKGKISKTTNSHFNAEEGYKYDGEMYGMGVCHLASLIHWTALDAGLSSAAPSNHDFAVIREIPKEYGVAIYSEPGSSLSSSKQNLYITNNKGSDVIFKFEYDGVNLKVSVLREGGV
jgi:hypothetical protein